MPWCHDWPQSSLLRTRGPGQQGLVPHGVLLSDHGLFVCVGKVLEDRAGEVQSVTWWSSGSMGCSVTPRAPWAGEAVKYHSAQCVSLEHTRPSSPLISAHVSPWTRLKLLVVYAVQIQRGIMAGWLPQHNQLYVEAQDFLLSSLVSNVPWSFVVKSQLWKLRVWGGEYVIWVAIYR